MGRNISTSTFHPNFRKKDIVCQSSCNNTTQQNGGAERKNRHLLEVTRALIFQKNDPKKYWGGAILTIAHLINLWPLHVLDYNTPMNLLTQCYPHFDGQRGIPPKVFGCPAFVYIQAHQRTKLDHQAIKCMFVGYSPIKKGCKCCHLASRWFYISMDVTFSERQPFFSQHYLQVEPFIEEMNFFFLPFLIFQQDQDIIQ